MPLDRGKLPSWSEFLYIANKQGVHIEEHDLKIEGPRGREPPVRYLQRPGGIKVIVPPLQLGDIIRENLLGSLCRQLDIDPTPLGISLEDLPPQSWP